MKLRTILLVLTILALLSATVAGYQYYSSLKRTEYKEGEKEVAVQAERIKNRLSAYLSENLKSVKAMSGLKTLERALSGNEESALATANSLLDHFQASLQADVCYLMDREGNTVASSNRRDPDSFVGENFSFRPYWRQAIRGTPSTYIALGVASGKRGVYYSHPIYGRDRGEPIGVAVIKAPVDGMEEGLRRDYEGIVLLTDPHGVVFLSNRPDWIYRTVWKLSPEEISEIVDSQQFGEWPWAWIGLTARDEKTAVDASGNEYLMYRMDIDRYPGWQVMYLHRLRAISRRLSVPFLEASGPIVLALCILVGGSVLVLYKKASFDILRRREAEEALRRSEERLRTAKEELHRYSRDLERQVGERTREITSILRNTPSVVYIKDKEGRYTLVNSRYEELFEIRNEEIQGKTDHDIFPREIADRFRENDMRVLADGHPCQVEERVPQRDGMHVYLSVKFPLYDEEGAVNRVCGISTDITALKAAQVQLRRLSDGIMASQEKERAAVARELHDELGQVLTALRIDSVRLKDRLKGTDDQAAERAMMMSSLIDHAIEEVRSMATRLRPGVLDDLGLLDALEWFAADFEKRTGIRCEVSHHGVIDVGDAVATAAYRIAQETLTNAARHSSATRMDLSLTAEDGHLTLAMADDGCGFDTKRLADSGGLGVAGMRERASLIGGTLEIHSQPGEGTRVVLQVPLDRDLGGSP